MHHHRLTLNGPPDHVAALAQALEGSGAVLLPGTDPPRVTWTTAGRAPLSAACAAHPRVSVGVERFTLLGETLERLVVRGADVTVLERAPFAPVIDPDERLDELLPEGCAPLRASDLHAAAQRVLAQPTRLPPGPAGTSMDDALLVGAAVGAVCEAALAAPPDDDGDPPPPIAILDALAGLGAAALTAGAAATNPAADAELAYERAHHLTEAHAIAAAERLWSRRGEADWPEWLMYILLGTATVVEDCTVAVHEPAPHALAIHAEHGATLSERLSHATTRLAATCLQALALFAAPENASGCARN
jgi:hypothetical protein